MPGKFIVLYGVNNLGKSTQVKLLTNRLNATGYKTESLKYAIYDLEPTGTIINDYLRYGNEYQLSPREAQIIYAMNRMQYESTLKAKLDAGINIIAEDYTGAGLSWGVAMGVDEEFLKRINSPLLREDIAFLFKGDRFIGAKEENHILENNNPLLEKARANLDRFGKEFGWIDVNANRTKEEVNDKIWNEVMKIINN